METHHRYIDEERLRRAEHWRAGAELRTRAVQAFGLILEELDGEVVELLQMGVEATIVFLGSSDDQLRAIVESAIGGGIEVCWNCALRDKIEIKGPTPERSRSCPLPPSITMREDARNIAHLAILALNRTNIGHAPPAED